MQLSPQLWEQIKAAERGYQGQGPDARLMVEAQLRPSADRREVAAAFNRLGGHIVGGQGGWVQVSLPACRVLEVLRHPNVTALRPAAQRTRRKGRIWLSVALLALVVALAASGTTIWKMGLWPKVSQALAGFFSPGKKTGPIKRDKPKPIIPDPVVPKRIKPKPVITGPGGKVVKPKPLRPQYISARQLYYRGLQAYYKKRKEQAVALWREALRKDPSLAGVRRSLGWALYEMGRRDEAVAQFRMILKGSPGDEEARAALELIGQGSKENPNVR